MIMNTYDSHAAQQAAYATLALDLALARWIWFPSWRTLPNTFVLFRREFLLTEQPKSVTGWIVADSRYRLTLNGERIQWGPPPSDPRWQDADPVDLTAHVQIGENVLGAEVLYYGHGEGTWPMGKPGLLCKLLLEWEDGRTEELVSDSSWQSYLDRAHRPGQYKRWYLRALQEEFDARLHPHGWDTPSFQPDQRWLPALELRNEANQAAVGSTYHDYLYEVEAGKTSLLKRQIPLLREHIVPAARLRTSGRLHWLREPQDWFEFRVPNSFEITPEPVARELEVGRWELPATPNEDQAVFATFEFAEQLVGWPLFTLDAPAGTIVELLYQEGHDPAQTSWLDTHHFSWSRFICREGEHAYEPFDFECLRWLQLHFRNATRPVILSAVGMRRRVYNWPFESNIQCAEPELQRLFSASLNTLANCAQETCVDGMGRERQQYSGDCGHQLQTLRYLHGETQLPARFLRTYSEGQTIEGYILDSWPAYDRLARIAERQIGLTGWGPMLDHSIGFVFDTWNHYLETGDLEAIRIPYPRLVGIMDYLERLRVDTNDADLLPVENIGIPTVWIDHEAYKQQRHKQCAFNLYIAAMLTHALAPLAAALDDRVQSERAARFGEEVLQATRTRFWSEERSLFVNNLPWLHEEHGRMRLCDRSLATSILFEQYPGGKKEAAIQVLVECPEEMGFSYPANAGWRLHALAKAGRIDVVLRDLRTRWASMRSVRENNTLGEFWDVLPDSKAQWSHCPIAPLNVLAMNIVGVQPLEPGFARYMIRPQVGDLIGLTASVHIPQGEITLTSQREKDGQRIEIRVPTGGQGELWLPESAQTDLAQITHDEKTGLRRYQLRGGESCSVWLP